MSTTRRMMNRKLSPIGAAIALAACAGTSATAQIVPNSSPASGAAPDSLMALLLPSAVGTANRATCAVDVGVDYRHPDLHVGGSVAGDSDGNGVVDGADFVIWQRASYWRMTASGIVGPTFLPQPAGGGVVNAVTADGAAGNDLVIFAGGVFVDAAVRPAIWTLRADGSVRFATLPTETNRGEALGVAVGDVNNDGVADIVVCGYEYDAQGNRVAAAWLGSSGSETFHELGLPVGIDAGPESTANAVTLKLENVLISGAVDTAVGGRSAALWTISDSVADVQLLGDLPPGASSVARTETVGANESIAIGGSRTESVGVSRPAVWMDIDRTGDFETRLLPTGPNPNGRVNSIIAILIGLVAAGETTGPNGSAAVVWIMAEWGHGMIDLNAVTRRPAGSRLTSASCLLPYVEQDNLYRIVGNATDRNGVSRGFIAGR